MLRPRRLRPSVCRPPTAGDEDGGGGRPPTTCRRRPHAAADRLAYAAGRIRLLVAATTIYNVIEAVAAIAVKEGRDAWQGKGCCAPTAHTPAPAGAAAAEADACGCKPGRTRCS